jgi:hypothetical protein
MTRYRRGIVFIAIAALLSACSGGTHASSLMPDSASRSVMDSSDPGDTLYVSAGASVSAFPLTASGAATPTRTFQVHPDQGGSIVGIETAATGDVEVLQSFQNVTAGIADCRIVEEPPTANGAAPKSNQFDCENNGAGSAPFRGRAIARGPNNEIDSLLTANGDDRILRLTFASGAAAQNVTSFYASGEYKHNAMAEAAGGHMFTSSSSSNAPIVIGASASTTGCAAGNYGQALIDNYSPGATSAAKTFSIAGRSTAGVLAVAPNNTTLYAATCTNAGALVIDAVNVSGATGSITPIASIGPFGAQNVTALAVDAQGNIYVGLSANDTSGTTNMRVYAPSAFAANASGTPTKPTPLRILNNPVPVSSGAKIVALAVSQGPFTATPSPVPTATPVPLGSPGPSVLSDGSFESGSVAPYGSTISSTGWTQCSIPHSNIPTNPTPPAVQGGVEGGDPATTPHPVSQSVTPAPGATPVAHILAVGTTLAIAAPFANPPGTPIPVAAPTPSVTSVSSHSGSYAAVFGEVFSNTNASNFGYNGLCQLVSVPNAGATMAFNLFGNGNVSSGALDFDVILLNSDMTWNHWLYDESYDSSSLYSNVEFGMPSNTLGGNYILFMGMWTSQGSAVGDTTHSGYYLLDDVTLSYNGAGGPGAKPKPPSTQ